MVMNENGLEAKLSEMNNSMLTHFDKIYGKLEKIDQENVAVKAGLKRVEKRLDGVEEKLERVESKLDVHMRQPAHA